jgi:hypothetical protein
VTMKNGVFWVLTRATRRNNPEDTILQHPSSFLFIWISIILYECRRFPEQHLVNCWPRFSFHTWDLWRTFYDCETCSLICGNTFWKILNQALENNEVLCCATVMIITWRADWAANIILLGNVIDTTPLVLSI